MNELLSAWEEMRQRSDLTVGLAMRRLETASPCAVFAAVVKPPNRPALVFEVQPQDVPRATILPRSRGLDVSTESVEVLGQRLVRVIVVLTDRQYEELFATLGEDLIRHVAGADTGAQAVKVMLRRLHDWQAFLKRFGVEGMSDDAQRGLFGELVALRQLLLPNLAPHEAMMSWVGPDAAPQDYVVRSVAVEVKTTTVDKGSELTISNLEQLSFARLDEIFLAHVMLAEVMDGGMTLGEIVGLVKDDAFEGDQELAEILDSKLLSAGYVAAQSERYTASYYISSISIFRVADGFPRIAREEVAPGVASARYAISVAACEPFRVPVGELVELLSGGAHGS